MASRRSSARSGPPSDTAASSGSSSGGAPTAARAAIVSRVISMGPPRSASDTAIAATSGALPSAAHSSSV